MSHQDNEPTEAQKVCHETYAALGSYLLELAENGHPQAEKLLDNLCQARLIHSDVLPFGPAPLGDPEGMKKERS